MGFLALNRLMSLQRERRRRGDQIRAHDGAVVSFPNGIKNSNRQCISEGGKRKRYSGPDLPEDIWRHILFLMPLRDAARAACVSHAFLRSWRCRPSISISREILCPAAYGHGKYRAASDFNRIVDNILRKHSGGLKSLNIETCDYTFNTRRDLDSWLEIAITPKLEELIFIPLFLKQWMKYDFPSTLLSSRSGKSIKHLKLASCGFSGTAGLDSLKNLTSLDLWDVRITEGGLGCLLSSSVTLEQLKLDNCHKIVCLKIPCLLQRLSYLAVSACDRLEVIEIKAPNISTFGYSGDQVKLSLGGSRQMKDIKLVFDNAISYSCAKLPSTVPNIETVYMSSTYEAVNTPMVPRTFLHLKFLCVSLGRQAFSPAYDCFSLVSVLAAAPSLKTFVLRVTQRRMQHDSIVGDPSPLRQMAGYPHNNLKGVKITGFCSAKCLVELTCYILKYAKSLDCLTLDTTLGFSRCSDSKRIRCFPMCEDMVRESQNALWAIEKYIEGNVPPAVKLNVMGHCSKCQGRL